MVSEHGTNQVPAAPLQYHLLEREVESPSVNSPKGFTLKWAFNQTALGESMPDEGEEAPASLLFTVWIVGLEVQVLILTYTISTRK